MSFFVDNQQEKTFMFIENCKLSRFFRILKIVKMKIFLEFLACCIIFFANFANANEFSN